MGGCSPASAKGIENFLNRDTIKATTSLLDDFRFYRPNASPCG